MQCQNTGCESGGWEIAQRCTVERVVPGRLVYVLTDDSQTCVFKLDKVSFRLRDGSLSRYRGERFSELALNVGAAGVVCYRSQLSDPDMLIIDTARKHHGPITDLASKTFGYLFGHKASE